MRLKDDKKHQAICKAAIDLITTNGFAETSMSKIAKAANISPATIYVYFENKEDLINKIYLMVKQEEATELLKGFDEHLSVEEKFKTAWHNFYKYAKKNPARFFFGEQFANSPLINKISKDKGLSYFQPMIEVFERGVQENIFKKMPLEIFASVSFYPIVNLIKQDLNGEFKLTKKALETVYEICWDAVAV